MTISQAEILISIDSIQLNGTLQIPNQPIGIVLFAHGSGSSRLSTRNQYVAKILNASHIATLLFDLLTQDEEKVDEISGEHRFNINLLATRLVAVTDWIKQESQTQKLSMGYFGASTGAGAALKAAAKRREDIKAIVSRGGRPDLAKEALSKVQSPTLLIVGGHDVPVIEMNQMALQQLTCTKKLVIVPKATHLFEEEGALDEVAHLASQWFTHYL